MNKYVNKYDLAARHLADKFIEQLADKSSRWHQDWRNVDLEGLNGAAYNPTTGKEYKGSNQLELTFKQWELEAAGAEPGVSVPGVPPEPGLILVQQGLGLGQHV